MITAALEAPNQDAPNTVDDKQLEELCLEIEIPEKE